MSSREVEPYSGSCADCDTLFINCTFENCPECGGQIIPDEEDWELE